MSKANKDGWIRHKGGKQPVSDDVRVEYRMRSGTKSKELAGSLAWNHENDRSDIMAYKPIYSGFEEAPMIEAPKKPEALVLDYVAPPPLWSAAEAFGRIERDDPRTMRDRIREIDATAIALNKERASLVAKLKDEGFALIQSEAESAQQDIAQQDMSDPANWRVGDLFEITGQDSHGFPMGELVKLIVFENDHDESDGHRYAYLDNSDYWWVLDCNVLFHSRPPQ